ncbi:MAG TPA: NADP-dependent oxidoreductase [Solirubrobacteraceae bacterium]
MQVVRMDETGGPEVLQLVEAERPEPGDGEVLVRVRAVAINPIDWKYRRGLMPKDLPAVLGSDISGVVEATGSEHFAVGDEVFGLAASGGYAEYALSPAGLLARKPAGLSHEQAAALPVAGMTAWQALFDVGGLSAGQSVLIAGAAGGVGHLATQFARVAGARVIGTASERNREFVLGLGAAQFVDYAGDGLAAVTNVDVAFDTVGGETTATLIGTLREGAIIVTIAGAPPEQAAGERGARAQPLVMSPNSDQLARIGELVASGEVQVEIASTMALSEVREAHALSESGHTRGKIILTLD